MGIEPATNLANLANQTDITTTNTFFSSKVGKEITQSRNACVVVANNVIGHVEDLQDLMEGIRILIGKNGVFIFEVPYLVDLIKKLEFDTIYHEHLSYLSVKPMVEFCKKFGFEIFDIKEQTIHGGTLRYFISRKNKKEVTQEVSNYLKTEDEKGLYSEKKLNDFANLVRTHRRTLLQLLNDLKKDGKKIVAISAPAKGNTLLNYF